MCRSLHLIFPLDCCGSRSIIRTEELGQIEWVVLEVVDYIPLTSSLLIDMAEGHTRQIWHFTLVFAESGTRSKVSERWPFSGQNPHFSKPYSSKLYVATSLQVHTGHLELESLYVYVFIFSRYGIGIALSTSEVKCRVKFLKFVWEIAGF